ncbi:MAG: DUF4168 domain-containing protein [Elusimicrobiota bacterium]
MRHNFKKDVIIISLLFIIGGCSGEKSAEKQTQQQAPDMSRDAQTDIEVSDKELNKFAQIMSKMQNVVTESQQTFGQAVQESELSAERYREITQSKEDPEKEESTTKQEQQQYQELQNIIEEIQTKARQEQMKIIEESGMASQRFQQIANSLRQDQELLKRYREIITEQSQSQ